MEKSQRAMENLVGSVILLHRGTLGDFRPEQCAVAAAFQKGFAPHQKEPLVLYGIGVNTEAILHLTKGFSIVGLLDRDSASIGKIFYGKPVLSLQEALALSHKIVIVAQPLSVPIIFNRIREFATEHHISIYDVSGRELGQEERQESGFSSETLEVWNHTKQELLESIARHDVISFDIFDTLLGRYVLHPTDVFELVEQRFSSLHGRLIPFKTLRTRAQQTCGYAPTLRDIYDCLCKNGVSRSDSQLLYTMEIQAEKQLIYPKQAAVELFRYAKAQGKHVFLTSDIYFSKAEMEDLLQINGICGYDGLMISCEEKAEKSNGVLFERLRKKAAGSILHIGDHALYDVAMAQRAGCDAWHLWNGYDLFAVSSLRNLLTLPRENFGLRLALGLACAKLFSDPFTLHKTRGEVELSQPEQIGYCFVGAWAFGFMQWMSKQADRLGIEQILYLSRDGFLFFNLGQIMQKYGYMPAVEQRYIKASRQAVSSASLCSEEDVKELLIRRESNYRHNARTKGRLLESFFSVSPEPEDKLASGAVGTPEEMLHYVQPYLPKILYDSAQKRVQYLKYLDSQGVLNSQKAAVFDFVAQGTVQTYLEKLMGKELTGFYMAVISHSREKFPVEDRIYSAFGNLNSGTNHASLAMTYVAIEALLVDGDEMFLYIDGEGKPVFRQCQSSPNTLALRAQEGARIFVNHYLELFGAQELELESLDRWLGHFFNQSSCTVSPELFPLFAHDEAPVEEIIAAWNKTKMNAEPPVKGGKNNDF